jgi:hypothetical protein
LGDNGKPVNLTEEMDNLSQEDSCKSNDTLDFCQLANYTVPEWLTTEDKMRQLEIGPELRAMVKAYLEKQGYEITEEAKRVGKSGIEHTFDMLARRENGFT